jgi:2-dehydro-3-deoxyphosphooctonate aldolase (KDO 8-P synthase)
MTRELKLNQVRIGGRKGFFLIAGPCVIESEASALRHARFLKKLTDKLEIPFIFKSSYDKANRTSHQSFRGPGLRDGIKILACIKEEVGVAVLADVHSPEEAMLSARVLDIVQIPAFLCRQTDLLLAAGKTGRIVNIKKGQFLAPWDIEHAIRKVESTGNKQIVITDRGTSFGYNNLVSDFRSIPIMQDFGYPVVYDATHSVQIPGGRGSESGGERRFVPILAQAAIAAGADGLFMEVHATPAKAKSDAATMLPMAQLEALLVKLKSVSQAVR